MLWGNQEGGLGDGDSAILDLEEHLGTWEMSITDRVPEPWEGSKSGMLQKQQGGHCGWRVRGKSWKVTWRGDGPEVSLLFLCLVTSSQNHPTDWHNPHPSVSLKQLEESFLCWAAGLGRPSCIYLEAPSLPLTCLYPRGKETAGGILDLTV